MKTNNNKQQQTTNNKQQTKNKDVCRYGNAATTIMTYK